MDPLEILSNIHMLTPYYQAVFSSDEHRVVGYELLAYFKGDQQDLPIGSLFFDSSVPEEYRIEIDDTVLEMALSDMIKVDGNLILFINRNPNLLMQGQGESTLQLLKKYEIKGLRLTNIVIEISMDDFSGDVEQLSHLLQYYKTYGLKIAVDDIGRKTSNLQTVGRLSPNIIRIDLQKLRLQTQLDTYEDVLYSFSLLARRVGATILYEDIEASYQLHYAWRNGGRYYQGYYLHKPTRQLVEVDILKERLREECHQFIVFEKNRIKALYELRDLLNERTQAVVSKIKKDLPINDWLLEIAKELQDISFRLYVCNEDGFQLSANVEKYDDFWEMKLDAYQKNWSWRPYFLENIIRMRLNNKGLLSDLYNDIDKAVTIRTFSFPLQDNQFLFVDLKYEYLYDLNVHL
ncbi:EAL domain-containing protein [Bacillus sp. HMF5848]|uniref:EAL domain-containing protein n=1 Tax=Bacillus sp. HMF5848 TaxID=2495421 RepID=UPI000F77C55B|nr:EAL-associated domain-containing protein [Bacillus sp. HMF5848]RSK26842.1 EAL domain-containing protein [Bacillus sp. HMF5848]